MDKVLAFQYLPQFTYIPLFSSSRPAKPFASPTRILAGTGRKDGFDRSKPYY
jgi:hypothetical protein